MRTHILKAIENHRINLDNITDEKTIKYLMGFRHFSTERVIKSMTYMLTDTDAWSVKGRLMGECWYKDWCILENGDRKHCHIDEKKGEEKMRVLLTDDEMRRIAADVQ